MAQKSNDRLRLGVDLGGTKIEVAVLAHGGKISFRRRTDTPTSYREAIEAISSLVNEARAQTGAACSIGLGIPGTISPATGLVKNANSTWLNGKPLDRDLEDALGQPVRIANDANCFALSEAVDGAAAGMDPVFGVILGTGVGGGIVLGGAPLYGANAIGGEWGHNPLPWPVTDESPGPECWCGQNGCIETYLSGPGLSRDHESRTGDSLDAAGITARAAAGDADCKESMARYEDRLARALSHVVNIVDPAAIVLGGGLSNCTRLYDSIPALWDRWIFSDMIDTRLLPPAHGDSSGVRGAAWLWPDESRP